MDLTDFILIDTFKLPIWKGVVIFPAKLKSSKHLLELEDIRRYRVVREFINSDTVFRLELYTLDKQRAFVFNRFSDCITILYFNRQ